MMDFLFKIIEWLFSPAPLVFLFIAVYILDRNMRKNNGASIKNNLFKRLNESVFVFPKQDRFDISIYGESLKNGSISYIQKKEQFKSNKELLKNLSFEERQAKEFLQFDFYQQYLNRGMDHSFIIERTNEMLSDLSTYDMPVIAICFKVYRGREDVGDIEVHLNAIDKIDNYIEARLKHPEMFDYSTIYSFFYCLAATHFTSDQPLIEVSLKANIQNEISNYLWDRMHGEAQTWFDKAGCDNWHIGQPLKMTFEGDFTRYFIFRDHMLSNPDLSAFDQELEGIKFWMERYDYREIKER